MAAKRPGSRKQRVGDTDVQLRLYVAGDGPNSAIARANVTKLLEQDHGFTATLTVVDIFDHPELALEDEVLVTPMLVRLSPPPRYRIVGTMSDQKALIQLLAKKDHGRAS